MYFPDERGDSVMPGVFYIGDYACYYFTKDKEGKLTVHLGNSSYIEHRPVTDEDDFSRLRPTYMHSSEEIAKRIAGSKRLIDFLKEADKATQRDGAAVPA